MEEDALAGTGANGRSSHALVWLTLGAITLRLMIFIGRGSYVAFDEGWYLLLGRNLASGNGYELTGMRHTVLSPLFPIFAGAFGLIIDNPIWAGRLVAAIASGLLVVPCWHVFRRFGNNRIAWIGCIIVATIPTLAPFAAPYWIGWDLWVGAEPLLHLFLYSGIALSLRAYCSRRTLDWAAAGLVFALAYLARPEAILFFGLCAAFLCVEVLRARRIMLVHAAVFGLAFAISASPYWIYLHDVLGRWTLTGRVVQLQSSSRDPSADGSPGGGAASVIEGMLWEDDQRPYMLRLYGLDASATRLSSSYWGVPSDEEQGTTPETAPPSAPDIGVAVLPPAEEAPVRDDVVPGRPQSRIALYLRSLGVVIPWFLWPFAFLGFISPRRKWRMEMLVVVPTILISVAIARIVAADPRTQLFVVPLVAWYAARGVHIVEVLVRRRWLPGTLRPDFVARAIVAVLTGVFLATEARWVYLGLSLGSPHHLVGAANRRAGDALRQIVPAGEPVMSWHPALALYARRDWRVLPHAPFDDVVRYATARGSEHVVLSVYYPSPLQVEQMPGEYLLVHVPSGHSVDADGLQLRIDRVSDTLSTGRVLPVR